MRGGEGDGGIGDGRKGGKKACKIAQSREERSSPCCLVYLLVLYLLSK